MKAKTDLHGSYNSRKGIDSPQNTLQLDCGHGISMLSICRSVCDSAAIGAVSFR